MSSAAFNNVEEALSFFNEHKDAVQKLLALKPSVPSSPDASKETDALGQRAVVQQAHSEATAPAVKKAGPLTAPKLLPRFASKSQEARNSMRLVNGPDSLFVSITQFGSNWYVPDFRLNHRLLHQGNRIIMANKRFYDSSEFFHPLLAHIYIGVIEIITIFRSLKVVGLLSPEQGDFLDWFESTYSYEALPVPGFMRNQLSTLASSSPALNSYDNVVPRLPPTTQASNATLNVIMNGPNQGDSSVYSYRIPNISALMSQLRAVTQVAVAAGATAVQIAQWVDFGTLIFGFASFGGDAGNPTHPANDRDRTALRTNAFETTECLFGSPGFETFNNPSRNVASTFLDYAQDLNSLFPALPANYISQFEITWRDYLCMSTSHKWFTEFARVMSFYCQFFKDSTNLGAITPIGNAGNQVTYSPASPPTSRPSSRFPTAAIAARGALYTLSVPEADATDSAIALLNLGDYYPVNDDARGGPFFTNLPPIKRTRLLEPENGYGQVLTDFYRLANAEQPQPE